MDYPKEKCWITVTKKCSGGRDANQYGWFEVGEEYEYDPKTKRIYNSTNGNYCSCNGTWQLVTNKKPNMAQSLKGLMSRLLDSDTQKLYKAEYINGDLQITEKGKNKILELLFVQLKAELVKLADEELKEAEGKK